MLRSKWIKKSVGLALVLTFLAVFPARGQIADVPPGHWAYQAVKKLVDEGYLQLYDDGTFRGSYAVDRFTLATVVAKLLAQTMESGAAMELRDMELLRALTNEFRSELVLLAARNEETTRRLSIVEEKLLVLSEDLTKNTTELRRTTAELRRADEESRRQIQENYEALQKLVAEILEEKRQLETSLLTLEKEAKTQNTRQDEELTRLRNELLHLRREMETERRKNRNLMLLVGLVGLLAGYSITQ